MIFARYDAFATLLYISDCSHLTLTIQTVYRESKKDENIPKKSYIRYADLKCKFLTNFSEQAFQAHLNCYL
jgi:hypothetical protein